MSLVTVEELQTFVRRNRLGVTSVTITASNQVALEYQDGATSNHSLIEVARKIGQTNLVHALFRKPA